MKRGQDPGYNPFELCAGVGNTDKWRGVRKQGAATILLPGEIREGINIRPLAGDGYVSRPGQSKLNSTAAVGYSIDGIFDAGDTSTGYS